MYVYGEIVSEKWFDEDVSAKGVADILAAAKAIEADEIDVFINSHGGNVFSGSAIYSMLKAHPAKINVQIDGIAASAASVIAMAGDVISISDAGIVMVHKPWSMAMGDAKEFRTQADVLDKIQESMAAAYERTGLDTKKINDIMDSETWMSAQEAIDLGFADKLVAGNKAAASATVPQGLFQFAPAATLKPNVAKTSTPPAPPTAANKTTNEGQKMSDEEINAKLDKAREEATIAALKGESDRKAAIKGIFKPFAAQSELLNTCLDDMNCSTAQANDKLLEALAAGQEPLGGARRVETTEDERDKFRAGMVDGILQRALVNKRDDSNPYRGFSMKDVARACVAREGHDVNAMSTTQIIQAALTSTSDFPVLFEEAMHKTLLMAYRNQGDTWSQFMATGTLTDFRGHNRYRLGTLSDLPVIAESAEIPITEMDDAAKEVIQAKERGMRFNLSFAAIVNDDLGGLTNIASQLGRSARRTIENTVYAELLLGSGLGPVMGDGSTLYHANHSNIPTAAAITVASLGAARSLMRKQMDPSNNEYIDLNPSVLLCPVELGDGARQVLMSETDFSGSKNSKAINPVRNMVSVIDTPRLSGTAWHLFTAPGDTAVGEVGFLNGATEPDVRTEEVFTSRGIQWRVTLDFGIKMLEWRATTRNAGA